MTLVQVALKPGSGPNRIVASAAELNMASKRRLSENIQSPLYFVKPTAAHRLSAISPLANHEEEFYIIRFKMRRDIP
jgi:hypothetical protein